MLAVWAASRLLVAIAVLAVAPHLPGQPAGFSAWDGGWYERIAATGYAYAPDGQAHSVAFFPLYPLLVHLVGNGAIVSHLAFLGALAAVYAWVADEKAARWSVLVLACCPYAIFASAVYSEASFLALTAVALWSFERGRYGLAGLAGALASATRVVGVALVPALAWVAWRERRPRAAWAAAAASGLGLLAYMAYLGLRFGDPLAFLHVQAAWRTTSGWGDDLPNKLVMIGGGLAVLRATTPVAAAYGLCAIALILASGTGISVDRYVYGVVSVSLGLGALLARWPRAGVAFLVVCVPLLVAFALRFGRGFWVA